MNFFKSEVDALAVRQEKRITLLDAEQYDLGFPPGRLVEFQAWFENLLAQIPEECRETAEIEFGSTGGYYDGDHYGKVEVTYRRYETDEEWEARKADVQRRAKALEEQQRAWAESVKPGEEIMVSNWPTKGLTTKMKVIGIV